MHHMDNWRETKYKDSFEGSFQKKLQRQLKKIEYNNNYHLVISDYMAEHYEKVYHNTFVPLMNTVTGIDIKRRSLSEGKKITITYAGGLHLGRWETIKSLEREIAINNLADCFSIIVYTDNDSLNRYSQLFDSDITSFRSYVSREKIIQVYKESELLLHVESFGEKYLDFTKYSLSTKIPEYLSSNRSILALGNKNLASIRYVQKFNMGYVATSEEEINLALNLFLSERNSLLQSEKMDRALSRFTNFHSGDYARNVFNNIFDRYNI